MFRKIVFYSPHDYLFKRLTVYTLQHLQRDVYRGV